MRRELTEPLTQRAGTNETFDKQDPDEVAIFVPERDQLADRQVMCLHAPSGVVPSIVVANRNCPCFPTRRQHGCINSDTVYVKPICVVKLGQLSKIGVDDIHHIDSVDRGDVDFSRLSQRFWSVGILPEDGLRTKNVNLVILSEVTCRPDCMFQFRSGHRCVTAAMTSASV